MQTWLNCAVYSFDHKLAGLGTCFGNSLKNLNRVILNGTDISARKSNHFQPVTNDDVVGADSDRVSKAGTLILPRSS